MLEIAGGIILAYLVFVVISFLVQRSARPHREGFMQLAAFVGPPIEVNTTALVLGPQLAVPLQGLLRSLTGKDRDLDTARGRIAGLTTHSAAEKSGRGLPTDCARRYVRWVQHVPEAESRAGGLSG